MTRYLVELQNVGGPVVFVDNLWIKLYKCEELSNSLSILNGARFS